MGEQRGHSYRMQLLNAVCKKTIAEMACSSLGDLCCQIAESVAPAPRAGMREELENAGVDSVH